MVYNCDQLCVWSFKRRKWSNFSEKFHHFLFHFYSFRSSEFVLNYSSLFFSSSVTHEENVVVRYKWFYYLCLPFDKMCFFFSVENISMSTKGLIVLMFIGQQSHFNHIRSVTCQRHIYVNLVETVLCGRRFFYIRINSSFWLWSIFCWWNFYHLRNKIEFPYDKKTAI